MKQFTVICTRDQYDEVAEILEGWGYYPSHGNIEQPFTGVIYACEIGMHSHVTDGGVEPRYTLEELRTMENPNTETL